MLFGRVTNAFDHSNSSGRWDSYYKYPYLADEKIGGPEHWQVQGHIASICIWQSWSTWPMYRSLNWWLLLSGSVIFDSLWPHILEHTGFLCPWDSPGKATRVGSHFLYQGSSLPRDRTCISCLGRQILYHWTAMEAPLNWLPSFNIWVQFMSVAQ